MRGLITEGILEVQASEDTSVIRLILEQNGKPFYVDIPAENLQAMLPIIMKTAVSIENNRENIAIEVADASVDLDQAGEVLLTLENTAGAHVCYGLSRSVRSSRTSFRTTAAVADSTSRPGSPLYCIPDPADC